MLELLIQGARIPQEERLVDVGVEGGSIVYLAPSGAYASEAAETVWAEGKLLLPGLVEPHIHLDKAHLLPRMGREASSLREAIRITAQMKAGFTKEDMKERSLAVLRQAVSNGVTHMRCHAEVDPILGLSGFETAMELKEEMQRFLDLQVVVFPQEGIFQSHGTEELMEEALRQGGDVVGGVPYQDSDADRHIDFVFRLADRFGVPADFHADFSDNPEDRTILTIADRTIAYGMQGHVAAGHVTSLGSMKYDDACRAAERVAEAGISVMSLPATDLFINGRGDPEKQRRGLTPVRLLQDRGVNVAVGVNNVRNAFTPFGKADPLEVAWLLAVTSYMGGKEDMERLIGMLTTGAARALGLRNYGMRVGAQADFVLWPAATERDVILDRPESRTVWKRGVKVAETTTKSLLYFGS